MFEPLDMTLERVLPPSAEKIVALSCIWFVIFINCYSVKLTQSSLKFFGYGKVFSIIVIIASAIVMVIMGKCDMKIWS